MQQLNPSKYWKKMFSSLHREENALCITASLSISLYHFLIYANPLTPSVYRNRHCSSAAELNLLTALSANVSTPASPEAAELRC